MSLAAFRRSPQQEDIAKLAEEHMKHDLDEEDRAVLKKAAGQIGWRATVGSVVGLGLGLYLAYRVRKVRLDMFRAFRAAEKPTHVLFTGGRTEPIPDLTPYMQPSRLGDFAAYFFFGVGGLFLGGETGLLFGTWAGSRTIKRDPERLKRIETGYRRFKVDYLRREAQRLESGGATGFN